MIPFQWHRSCHPRLTYYPIAGQSVNQWFRLWLVTMRHPHWNYHWAFTLIACSTQMGNSCMWTCCIAFRFVQPIDTFTVRTDIAMQRRWVQPRPYFTSSFVHSPVRYMSLSHATKTDSVISCKVLPSNDLAKKKHAAFVEMMFFFYKTGTSGFPFRSTDYRICLGFL